MNTEVAVRDMNAALERPKEIEALLLGRAQELDTLLMGSDVPRDKFIRGVVLGLASNPEILGASRNSILLACLEAAEMGLVPSGQFGGAYLVKFKNEVQLIVDWRGYIKMALRSGQVRKVEADNVYDEDYFDYQRGTDEYIHHRPSLDIERGNWSHTYAIVTLTDGTKQFEVLSAAQVEAIRAGRKHVWLTNPEEMRRKTAVRRVFKYVPQAITPQLQFAMQRDDRLDAEVEPAVVSRIPSRRIGLAAAIVDGSDPVEELVKTGMDVADAEAMIDGRPIEEDDLP